MAEVMHSENDDSETEEDLGRAMIEQIKRDSLKQLEEAEKVNQRTVEDHNVSTTDIFYQGDDAKGFFLSSGETYIYPTNYPIRDYQRNIVHSCLFDNTLVSLPTGLGKTFIAAVVMFNFYRWYPRGKVVFMAPTRPLVSQQMRACYDIMGIPVEDTIELLGSTPVTARKKEWNEKRVFYVTPQTIDNDLKSGVFNPEHLKCLVVDEAHRATKNYAYCQVVQQLKDANVKFRTVALSATPGREIQDVINLILKLDIAKLELRSENSIDIVPYTHSKKIDSVEVPLSDLVLRVREEFLKIVDKYTRSLKQNKVLVGNTGTLTKFTVMLAKDRYVRTKAQFPHINRDLDKMIQRDFHVTHSLASALENLTTYGLRSFYNNLVEVSKEDGSCPLLGKDNDLQTLLQQLKPKLDINIMSTEYAWSHLKFIRLREILEAHFRTHAEKGETTKVIIFANFRIVVSEIFDVLKSLEPMVKASMFVGQSSGVTQQEQKDIMRKFRDGEFNTLIATSVGEEGLDIGEIDLVVCFDSQKSPIKLVQRLGRTGRKRNGRCVFLLTQGREAQNFKTGMQTCKSYVEKIINNKSIYANLSRNGPRMIPMHVNPTMRCLHIVVKDRTTPAKPSKKKGKENEKTNKRTSKKKLENAEPVAKSSKPAAKKLKKQELPLSQTNDIRTCFENITKKKKTFIDFLTQSSGEPVTALNNDNDDEVIVVEDQLSEFEQIFSKLEIWAEKCAANDELILDDQFFGLIDHFLISDADQTPVDVMDVDEMLDAEDRILNTINEEQNNVFDTSNLMSTPKISTQQRPKSPDFSDTFHMDLMHVFTPYNYNHTIEHNGETLRTPVKLSLSQSIANKQKSFQEEVLDDGNDDMFLNINSLIPSHKNSSLRENVNSVAKFIKPLEDNMHRESIKSNQIVNQIDAHFPFEKANNMNRTENQTVENKADNKQLDTSVYQSVDELFASDEDEKSPVIVNNDIRSYFVSENEIRDAPSYVEPMSISDLFEDSPEDDENPEENVGDKELKEKQHPHDTISVIRNNTPKRDIQMKLQDLPCSSTPMISNSGGVKKLPYSMIGDRKESKDPPASPDINDIFFTQNKVPASVSNKSQRRHITPDQKVSQYFGSPDVSEIKSQAIKTTTMGGVKVNLESKFPDTSMLFATSKNDDISMKYPSCEIIFDSDSDDKNEHVSKANNCVTSLDGSNMFTVTQLVDMACEREKKAKESMKTSCTPSCAKIANDLEQVCSNKENMVTRIATPRKLDGMEIVDSSDDEVMQCSISDKSLIDSYISTKHLAEPKPYLPPTKSVLAKLAFLEKNQAANSVTTKLISNTNAIKLIADTSSDEDLEFFIPKRNPKKDPPSVPKSPLLVPKFKSKTKIASQNQTENSRKKNTSKMSNLSLNDSAEELELLKSLADTTNKLGPRNAVAHSTDKMKTTATASTNSFFRTPFTLSQASKQPRATQKSSTSNPLILASNKVSSTSSCVVKEVKAPSNIQPSLRDAAQPSLSANLEAEFGGMTDAQFEQWLKSMNNEPDVTEPEPVRSQYFQSKPSGHNMNQLLMSNRLSQREATKTTLTRREKEDYEKAQRTNVRILNTSNKSSSSNYSTHYISSEEDEDLHFFRTTGKPETRRESRTNKTIRKLIEPTRSKATSSVSKTASTRSKKKNSSKKKPANPYIEVEADVSLLGGERMSSDDDLTNSDEDEMDSSFIDDAQDRDHTMAVYLESVKSPQNAAKFKIPVLSDTVMEMDVFSQAVAPDRTEYLNDSFCVSDEEQDEQENDMSLLEIAEARLERERQRKKKGREKTEKPKQRRRVIQVISSSDDD